MLVFKQDTASTSHANADDYEITPKKGLFIQYMPKGKTKLQGLI